MVTENEDALSRSFDPLIPISELIHGCSNRLLECNRAPTYAPATPATNTVTEKTQNVHAEEVISEAAMAETGIAENVGETQ